MRLDHMLPQLDKLAAGQTNGAMTSSTPSTLMAPRAACVNACAEKSDADTIATCLKTECADALKQPSSAGTEHMMQPAPDHAMQGEAPSSTQ